MFVGCSVLECTQKTFRTRLVVSTLACSASSPIKDCFHRLVCECVGVCVLVLVLGYVCIIRKCSRLSLFVSVVCFIHNSI